MVRPSLPYQGIAIRALRKPVEFDDWIVIEDAELKVQETYSRDIDIQAVVTAYKVVNRANK